jgi:hypothetical protein
MLTNEEIQKLKESVQYYPDYDDPLFATVETIVEQHEAATRAMIAAEVLDMELVPSIAERVAVQILKGVTEPARHRESTASHTTLGHVVPDTGPGILADPTSP